MVTMVTYMLTPGPFTNESKDNAFTVYFKTKLCFDKIEIGKKKQKKRKKKEKKNSLLNLKVCFDKHNKLRWESMGV